ncbi:FKBP-type peptidyl-prolyl cis-trans isomerase [Thiocystis violacea]|uniref:FKBP-type peptidyl-prolyl cis-trans isomerase n=1 Tax=Thiocystis violacea TaxID=13725 RepID=UPI0019080BE6|nr:peptidylprolyl isomerase [Thiocystis violacea]MBK1717320.1 peptidylprolyl isomerase [Thiocystis violacea]
MTTAKLGDRVEVHYRGTLADGTTFDSSRGRELLVFTLGQGQMLPDFEEALIGMGAGERKTIIIPCESAYGEHDTRMNLTVPKDAIDVGTALEVGTILRAQAPDGETASFTIVALDAETVSMDGNHPLAGHDLTFDLELVRIVASAPTAASPQGLA